MTSNKNLGITSCLMALESRIMYDAAGMVTAVDPGIDNASQESADSLLQDKAAQTQENNPQSILNLFEGFVPPVTDITPKEIIIIDSDVENYQQLIQGISPDARVIVLASSKDGLGQINDILSNFENLDAIHIVSHGDSGSLLLGNTPLNLQNLDENASQVETWGQSLSEEGDIMLYGCDVAKGEEGQLFVNRLSELTDADVAASTDPTGHENLGGDWDLESQTGNIETAIAFSDQTKDEYYSILADTPTAIGSEFQVHTLTTFEALPSVAALDGGGFVVVWQEFNQTGDADGYGVFGQRYDSAGNLDGGGFIVNTYVTANQHDAQVTGLSGGGFAVVWNSNGQDGSVHGIYTRIYNAAGAPVTGEIQVNTYTTNNQLYPDIAKLSGGSFVVTWDSYGPDGDLYGVFGRQFNAGGTPITGEFQVNTTIASWQDNTKITALSDGGYLITWESFGQDGDGEGIFGQRYNAASTAVGGEFQINTYTASEQYNPHVAGINNGGFVVVWQSNNQDGDGYGIFGQRYDSSSNPVSGEFMVNTYTSTNQHDPEITALNDGGFVVTWTSVGQSDVCGQRYDSNGNALGSEFVVNTTTTGVQNKSSITTLENGDFVAVWQYAPSNHGTYGQMFTTNFSPVLDNTGTMTLTSIPKIIADPPGDTVNEIIASAGGDRITDVDSGALEGIAITNVDETNGTWWFSTNNGSTWTSMTGASNTSAVLLASDANTRIRFIPNGTNFGTNTITFRAWDQSSGSNGDTSVDTTNNGGNTSFSTATETASVYVDNIPSLSSSAVTAYTENASATIIDSAITLGDDSVNMIGAKITISANYIEGKDVLNFTVIGSVTGVWDAPSATLILSGSDTVANYQTALRSVTFESSADNPGEMGGLSRTISFSVDDGLNTSPVATSTVNITAVNDAPLANTQPHIEVIYRGSPEIDSGISLAEKIGGDVDMDGDPIGIAVVNVDETNGVWQYTVDGGSTWSNFITVSDTNATLLAPTGGTRILFTPNDTAFFGTATMNIRIWDQTTGSHGQTGVDVSVNGGANPYSSDLETLAVDIRDIPIIPPPDASGEPLPPSGTGFGDFSEPIVEDRGGDTGLISDTLTEFTEPSDPPFLLDTSLFPFETSDPTSTEQGPELFPENIEEPGPEEIDENNDEFIPEELLEETSEKEIIKEESENDALEKNREETIVDPTSDAPVAGEVALPGDGTLVPPQETAGPPVEGGLSEQLVLEGQKDINEPIQILKVFEEVYELLQCK
ncbi:MAG: DUF4347 domain-containing protein [Desulfobacteraceae bacterium]|nr:DUF4347 domain-containing protein [Desulfobacteraceae bacterium]